MKQYIVGPKWDQRVITIDPKGDKIGIAMSGGIDSWVLYNLLPNKDNIIIYTFETLSGVDDVETVYKLTGRDDIIVLPTMPEDPTPVKNGLRTIVEMYNLDQIYTGVNQVPHYKYFPEFAEQNEPPRPWRIDSKVIITPFLHLYKYHIIWLAQKIGLDLSATESCTTQKIGHCGTCWWCREKQWAYDQLK